MHREQQRFVAAKKVSPLVLGRGASGSTVASDPIALHGHADELIYLEDDQLAILDSHGINVFDRASMQPICPVTIAQTGPREDIGLGAYPDFLSKEIAEQPQALRRLVRDGQDEIRELAAAIREARRVVLLGCGTAGNAAMAGAYLFNELCSRDVAVAPASEFRYRRGALIPKRWSLPCRRAVKRWTCSTQC
jgi:glucosamine--fructose-6-phosphate aminotransferase (isomerizing)